MEKSEDSFIVKFRGVRGSHSVADKNFLEFGGNTSCVEVHAGGHLIILDAGTGIISLGKDLVSNYNESSEKEPINALLLLSHVHQDHLQGLTFFRPTYLASSVVNILGHCDDKNTLSENISTLSYGNSFPLSFDDIVSTINISNIFESQVIVLSKNNANPIVKQAEDIKDYAPDDVVIKCMKLNSHPKNGVMAYKVSYKGKSVVYATDKENSLEDIKFAVFAKDCDLLIHDAQYTNKDYDLPVLSKQGYGHSTFEMAIATAKVSNVKSLAFFHYDPDYDDYKLSSLENIYKNQYEKCFMSKEGQEIILI